MILDLLKKISFGLKVAGGFACMLCFIIVGGTVGYTALSSVVKGFDKVEVTNRVIHYIYEIRENENDFIFTQDEKYHQQIIGRLDKSNALINDIKHRLSEKDHLDLLINCQESLKLYQKQISGEKDFGSGGESEDHTLTALKAATRLLAKQREQIDAQVSLSKNVVVLGTLTGIVFGIFLAYILARTITRPFSQIVSSLNSGVEITAAATREVVADSEALARGTTEQASSIEETSSTLEQMTSVTRQNADNAQQANTLMKESNNLLTAAGKTMEDLNVSMNEISAIISETSTIIKTIDEIAFQTNLLALNAAVEAARAGEAGAGFAVVADEVRSLALRAAEAAKNTEALIDNTVTKIEVGVNHSNRTSETFSELMTKNRNAGTLVDEIATASREQSRGIENINTAIGEVDKVVHQNAAGAEQSVETLNRVSERANEMSLVISDLTTLIYGIRREPANGRQKLPVLKKG